MTPVGNLVAKTPWWLWFSVPIATLAIAASLSGIFVDSVYARETENWAAQGVGQDIANLIAYPFHGLVGLFPMVVGAVYGARLP